MVFDHLDHPTEHETAEIVTNNHFDQDGAVGLFALTDPVVAVELRELLVDLTEAGDFGTYRYREAARASMTLSAFADPSRSPLNPNATDTDSVICTSDRYIRWRYTTPRHERVS